MKDTKYRLVARKGTASSVIRFDAADDADAQFAALNWILSKAYGTENEWATGDITLYGLDGEVLNEMGAK